MPNETAEDRHQERFNSLFGAKRSNAGPDPDRDASVFLAPGDTAFALDAHLLNKMLPSVAYGEFNHDDPDDLSVMDFGDTPSSAVASLLQRACSDWKVVSQPDPWTVRYNGTEDQRGTVAVENDGTVRLWSMVEDCDLLSPNFSNGGLRSVEDILGEA
jgi:hypothetical protein